MAGEKIVWLDSLKEAFLEYDKNVVGFNEAVFVTFNSSTYEEVQDAVSKGKILAIIDNGIVCPVSKYTVKETSIEMHVFVGVSPLDGVSMMFYRVSDDDSWYSFEYNYAAKTATEVLSGTVKLNPSANIDLDEDGKLVIGGRLGQTELGGLYYPLTSIPVRANANSLLLSEAVGLTISSRSLSIAGGNNVTLKVTAQAGATTYEISNTQNNRFICACWADGRLATSQDGASEKTVAITSVKFANGNNVIPYFGATEADNNIIVTVEETLNPDSTLSAVRGYGRWTNTDTLSVGQGNSSTSGKTLLVGMSLFSNPGSQNQVAMIGNRVYTTKGSCILVGADIINASQFAAIFGEGHNSTGGPSAISLLGRYTKVSNNTLMAVGNGTNDSTRSNAFEVKTDGRVKASTPTEDDDLATKAYVDAGGGSIGITTYGNADFTYQQELDPDTQEVLNECVPYSTVAGSAEEPKAVKYGRMVNLCGAFKNINLRPNTGVFVMGKVPAGCEPLYRQCILEQGTSQAKFLLTIETDGTLKCARYSTGASAIAVPDKAWLNINATYVSGS